ncbi:MAG: hypothetical protein H6604_00760 [Flavobacteriales bacterium]|nr:hypothetical protein [Flavobacteriales bacterium]
MKAVLYLFFISILFFQGGNTHSKDNLKDSTVISHDSISKKDTSNSHKAFSETFFEIRESEELDSFHRTADNDYTSNEDYLTHYISILNRLIFENNTKKSLELQKTLFCIQNKSPLYLKNQTIRI